MAALPYASFSKRLWSFSISVLALFSQLCLIVSLFVSFSNWLCFLRCSFTSIRSTLRDDCSTLYLLLPFLSIFILLMHSSVIFGSFFSRVPSVVFDSFWMCSFVFRFAWFFFFSECPYNFNQFLSMWICFQLWLCLVSSSVVIHQSNSVYSQVLFMCFCFPHLVLGFCQFYIVLHFAVIDSCGRFIL